MIDYSGSLQLKRADGYSRAIIDLSYAPSLADVKIFAAACYDMTTAKIGRCTYTQGESLTEFPGTGGELYDLAYAAHFKFRRLEPVNPDSRFRNFRLPAPKLALFELIEGKGYRIKKEYGDIMAAAFSIVAGEPLQFDSGWMVH